METSQTTPTRGTLKLYGAGGAGTNLVAQFNDFKEGTRYADISVAYLDTSLSNMASGLRKEDCFILSGIDGAGKKRDEHHVEIAKHIKQMILTLKPADFNVVVFSASGGSGSVIGPLLLSELLARKIPVVGIVVGSAESELTAMNTLKTIKSLDSIARKVGLPVVISFEQNDRNEKRSEVDAAVQSTIHNLAQLTSRGHHELDTSDITNWVQFTRVTDVEPQLALLEVVDSEDMADGIDYPVSIASLLKSHEIIGADFQPDYNCTGYRRNGIDSDPDELHFIVATSAIPEMMEALESRYKVFTERRQSRPRQVALANDPKDTLSDDGLVF